MSIVIPTRINQTTAEWATDSTVYSANKILCETNAFYGATDQCKFKLADGVQTWAQLNYFPVSGFDDATSSIQTQLDSKQTTADFFASGSNAYADNTTFYFGQTLAPVTATSQTGGVPLRAGTIVACLISLYNGGTVGSTENCTLNLIHGSSYGTTSLIANDIQLNANRQSIRMVTGLNIDVSADCSALANLTTPLNLTTNPNGLQIRITFFYA